MAAAVKETPAETKTYQAFVAGVFSGIAKLCGKYKGGPTQEGTLPSDRGP